MWSFFIGGHSTYGRKTFTLATPGLAATADAVLLVRMHGSSSTGVEGEHILTVVVNGTPVGTGSSTGRKAFDLEVTIPAGLLVDGDNAVELVASKGEGAPYSITYLNEFDLTYPRRLEADGDRALLRDAEPGDTTVSGFVSEAPVVWDIDNPAAPLVLQGVSVVGDKVAFAAEPGHDYIIFGDKGLLGSVQMASMQTGVLASRTNAADYVIITVPELAEGATALAEYRAGLGLKTITVMLEGIYDEFSHGIETPDAIKAFLSYAYSRWRVRPSYVVLAGEGTYDYKGTQGTEDCLVPPMRVATPSGLFASDNWFVDFNNDLVPELPIGRLPVMTSEELLALVEKFKAYEAAAEGAWQRRALFIADNRDSGGNFSGASDLLGRHLPSTYHVLKAYLDEASLEDTRIGLLSAMNEGVAFMNYFGHSGLDRMANEGLLTSADIESLANGGRLPVFTSMSCVMGRFAVPGYDCLAEELLLKPDGGCAAVWSPSGMALNPFSRMLAEDFYAAVFERSEGVLGDAIMSATRNHAARVPSRNALVVFNLLGDPALRISGRPTAAYPGEKHTYDRWKARRIGRSKDGAVDLAPEADADGDGISNIREYAFGSDPLKANEPARLRLGSKQRNRENKGKPYDMEILYERNRFARDIDFIIETTEDFVTWRRDGYHIADILVSDNADGLTQTVRVRIKLRGPKGRCFARLRLEPVANGL
jgi:hypothetical protein